MTLAIIGGAAGTDVPSEFDYNADGTFSVDDVVDLLAAIGDEASVAAPRRFVILGDLNRDQRVTLADVRILAIFISRPNTISLPSEELIAADVNEDGRIDEVDLQLVVQSLGFRL